VVLLFTPSRPRIAWPTRAVHTGYKGLVNGIPFQYSAPAAPLSRLAPPSYCADNWRVKRIFCRALQRGTRDRTASERTEHCRF